MYCKCGCGGITSISKQNENKRGYVKGKHVDWLPGHNNNYQNGRIVDYNGYVRRKKPEHHKSDKNGYAYEHILIAEKALGKKIPNGTIVHHVDGDTTNNKKSNLVLCQNISYHKLLHRRERALKECGDANYLRCPFCKKYDDPKNLYISPNGRHIKHKSCAKKYYEEWKNKRILGKNT